MKFLKLLLCYAGASIVCMGAGFWQYHTFNVEKYSYPTTGWLVFLWLLLSCFATMWYIVPFNSDRHDW